LIEVQTGSFLCEDDIIRIAKTTTNAREARSDRMDTEDASRAFVVSLER
jgi:hypothetical protein